MAVFRVEKNSGYTVMSNHHLRNRALSLKAKGLLSQMLSLPEDWDYTLQGLARINRESIDAIRQAIRELEQAGYIQRSRERDEKGRLRGADYVIFELPQPVPASVSPTLENPTLENPTQENPTLENPMQLNAGKITIGGTDVRDFKLDSLMKNISMVFQSVYLFADTIENNIKFGYPDATHEQVVEAAKKACCHNFISALPDGYDTVIGEGGGTLSGGEKQRISIARAMLKDAPIIILDEATSSVDPENEDELQRAIEALTHDKTIIMIAHRLKTVRNADQILVLDNAHIVQRGTHAELIQQKGLYADFVSARQEAIGWKLAQ